MKAVIVSQFGGPEVLKLGKRTRPRCKKNEVQVEIHAAGVNALDRRIRNGEAADAYHVTLPFTPGWDFSGVVSGIGKDVTRFKKGDKVYGQRQADKPERGCYAEYITLPEDQLARKPVNLSHAAAAAVPTPALAAWQALRERAAVGSGDRVLIHGGSGGVGSFAVQLAHLAGAWVIATASSPNHDDVLDLGADEVIDYQQHSFRDVLKRRYPQGLDIVLDTIGGATLRDSVDVMKSTGRIFTLADPEGAAELAEAHPQPEYLRVRSDGEMLEHIAALFDENLLRTTLAGTFPLEDVRAAHELLDAGIGQGRIVLTLE